MEIMTKTANKVLNMIRSYKSPYIERKVNSNDNDDDANEVEQECDDDGDVDKEGNYDIKKEEKKLTAMDLQIMIVSHLKQIRTPPNTNANDNDDDEDVDDIEAEYGDGNNKEQVIVTIMKKKVTKIMKTNLQMIIVSKKDIDFVLPNFERHANGNDNNKTRWYQSPGISQLE